MTARLRSVPGRVGPPSGLMDPSLLRFSPVWLLLRFGTSCRRLLSATTRAILATCCVWTGPPLTQMWCGPEGGTSPCTSGGFPNKSSQSRLKVKTSHAALAAASRPNRPLVLSGKKSVKLKEKSKVNRKQKKASGAAGAAQLEMNGETASEGQAAAEASAEVSGEDEREEVGSSNSSAPAGNSRKASASVKQGCRWRARGPKTHWWTVVPVPVESQTKALAVVKSRDKHGTAPTFYESRPEIRCGRVFYCLRVRVQLQTC